MLSGIKKTVIFAIRESAYKEMPGFFTSVEFYVILFTIAVAWLGFASRESRRGEALTWFFRSTIVEASTDREETLYVEALEDGRLMLIHRAARLTDTNLPAIALTLIGNDIKIVEKIEHPVPPDCETAYDIIYVVDCLRNDRYHIYFDSVFAGIYASATVRNTAPFHITIDFHR